jgi:hypothetical protein
MALSAATGCDQLVEDSMGHSPSAVMISRTCLIAAFIGGTIAGAQAPVSAKPVSNVSYRLAVTNSMPHAMNLSYRDTAEHSLGVIAAEERKVFSIVDPARATIMLKGFEPTGTIMADMVYREITLRPDSTVEVTL